MKKNKQNQGTEPPAPWPEPTDPEIEPAPEPPRKKRSFGRVLLTILLFIILIGIILLILPLEKVANYTPDQWFKRELRINADLPQKEKDAVNTIYNGLIARLDHDKPSGTLDPGQIDNYAYLANMHPDLQKYSRISLLRMLDALKQDIGDSGIFVKRDFFLNYLPDADVLQWEVQYNRSSDLATPSYFLIARIRNSTGAAISKILVEIDSPADTATADSTMAQRPAVREIFTLLPAEKGMIPSVETYNCPIRKDQFDYLNGRGGNATLKKVFLEELQY